MAWKSELAPWLKGIGIFWLIGATINIVRNWIRPDPPLVPIPVHMIIDLIVIAPGIVLIMIARRLRHPTKSHDLGA
jgi:hypothetical protein